MSNTTRTDIELMELYSEEVADLYQKAKKIASLAPRGCLVELRIILERFVFDLAESYQLYPDQNKLFETIEKLRNTKKINPALLDRINEIRIKANEAVHYDPDSQGTGTDFRQSAQDCLIHFCDLVGLYRSTVLGQLDNKFEFEQESKSKSETELMKLCYDSLFSDDAEQRYRMVRVLQEKMYSTPRGTPELDIQMSIYKKILEVAADHDGQPEAIIDYAELKLYGWPYFGITPEKDTEKVIERLEWIANTDVSNSIDAKALLGRAILVDKKSEDPPSWEIRHYLECLNDAADAENTLALTTLGILYGKGEYVEQDTHKAYQLLRQSAQLGDATAQVCLADISLFNGDKDQAIQHLKQAIEAGYWSAYLQIANLLSSQNKHTEAIDAYEHFLGLPNKTYDEVTQARIGMADAIIKLANGNPEQLILGLQHLIQAVQIRFESISNEDRACANKIAAPALKKLKGRITVDMYYEHTHCFISFNSEGKIKQFADVFPNGQAPETNQIYDFFGKRNTSIKRMNKPGRNDFCPCKSGKKYKICCG